MTTLEIVQTTEFDELVVSEEVVIVEANSSVVMGLPGPKGDPGVDGQDGAFDGTWSILDINTSGTIVTDHAFILLRGSTTLLELPQSIDNVGKMITLKNLAGHPVTVVTVANQVGIMDHIDGELSSLLLGTLDSISLLADDSGWVIV